VAGKKLNKTDRDYIATNHQSMSPSDLSAKINKSEDMIVDYITDLQLKEKAGELRSSRAWKQLRQEMDEDELEYFEEQYVKYMAQFREDVLVTEETQIFLVIKFEIMMHRNAKGKRNAAKDIGRLVRQQEQYMGRFSSPDEMSDTDRTYLLNLETQIQAAKASEQARSTEYIKLEEKHQALLKDLKATRDQRVTRIESSKETYLSIIKKLQNEEERDLIGGSMETMKMATKKEEKKLTSVHTFEDGSQDLPVLIPKEKEDE
jgi:hypothetical protein